MAVLDVVIVISGLGVVNVDVIIGDDDDVIVGVFKGGATIVVLPDNIVVVTIEGVVVIVLILGEFATAGVVGDVTVLALDAVVIELVIGNVTVSETEVATFVVDEDVDVLVCKGNTPVVILAKDVELVVILDV